MNGVVGAFNLQGSSWDRRKKKFYTHNKNVKPVVGTVSPSDVVDIQSLTANVEGFGGKFILRRANRGSI